MKDDDESDMEKVFDRQLGGEEYSHPVMVSLYDMKTRDDKLERVFQLCIYNKFTTSTFALNARELLGLLESLNEYSQPLMDMVSNVEECES